MLSRCHGFNIDVAFIIQNFVLFFLGFVFIIFVLFLGCFFIFYMYIFLFPDISPKSTKSVMAWTGDKPQTGLINENK